MLLSLFQGHGASWEIGAKVTFDGDNKLITVHDDVTELNIRTDVYSRWVDWAALPGNSVFWLAFRYSGLDSIPGGQTGDIYFIRNDWKLIINLNKVAVSGVLYSDDYATAYWDDKGNPLYPAKVSSLVNTVTNVQNIVTGDLSSLSIPTANQNANAVWGHVTGVNLSASVEFIQKIEGGRWKIITNQMIFYAPDNVTELARFNLFDGTGAPTMNNPVERVRV